MNDGLRNGFLQGTDTHAYRFMGCHCELRNERNGYIFRVWAPNASGVSVTGDFNGWDPAALPMEPVGDGFYEAFTADARELDAYKYYITQPDGSAVWKADPFGFYAEDAAHAASRIYDPEPYDWADGAYRRGKARKKLLQNPVNVYQVHPGSWRHGADGRPLSYEELAEQLVSYVREMGYTHIEWMAGMSRGTQGSVGYFMPETRHGTPNAFRALVDACHAAGIGVIAVWDPCTIPASEQGLRRFDGGCCFERPACGGMAQDEARFDYTKGTVRSFLLSSALYWLEEFHLDGLRLNDLAGVLSESGGAAQSETEEAGADGTAAAFFRCLNREIAQIRGNILMIAEETGAYPYVTGDTGTLGFSMKWASDWTEQVLAYLERDPIYRSYHQDVLSFPMTYFDAEQFLIPLSCRSVMAGRSSLIERMPGYYDDKFANLRVLFGLQMAYPGKKLNFMGNEIGMFRPWEEERPLDWMLLEYDRHRQLQAWSRALNFFYAENRALWQLDYEAEGFHWISFDDREHSVLALRRCDRRGKELIAMFNFCPVLWERYRLGVPKKGCYLPVLCSDDLSFGGTGVPIGTVRAEPVPSHGQAQSAEFTLPPLSVTFYAPE